MIRVNLLPQELRRRSSTSVNPETMGMIGGAVVVGLMVFLWFWVQGRIQASQDRLDQANAELTSRRVNADKVRTLEKEIIRSN